MVIRSLLGANSQLCKTICSRIVSGKICFRSGISAIIRPSRWSRYFKLIRRHLPGIARHRYGTKTARTTIETCARLNIEALTLYAFSVENWRRPKVKADFLMQLLREYIRKEMPLIQRNNIRTRFLGRIDELPLGV